MGKRKVGLAHIGAGDFHRAEEYVLQGKLATEDSIFKIRKQLEA